MDEKPKPLIGDLAGLGEVLNAEVTKQVYEDALSGAMTEFGEALTDTVAGLRLLTMPFILAAAWTKKLKGDCEEVLSRVPPERRTQAPPEIAGPVFQSLVYTNDNTPLKQMYLNLLERAIDKERQGEAHPAFARIIDQLSGVDAKLLCYAKQAVLQKDTVVTSWGLTKAPNLYVIRVGRMAESIPKESLYISLLNIDRLLNIQPQVGYLARNSKYVRSTMEAGDDTVVVFGLPCHSNLAWSFCVACVPDLDEITPPVPDAV